MTRKTYTRKILILCVGALAVLALTAAVREDWGRAPAALAFLVSGCLLAYAALRSR